MLEPQSWHFCLCNIHGKSLWRVRRCHSYHDHDCHHHPRHHQAFPHLLPQLRHIFSERLWRVRRCQRQQRLLLQHHLSCWQPSSGDWCQRQIQGSILKDTIYCINIITQSQNNAQTMGQLDYDHLANNPRPLPSTNLSSQLLVKLFLLSIIICQRIFYHDNE